MLITGTRTEINLLEQNQVSTVDVGGYTMYSGYNSSEGNKLFFDTMAECGWENSKPCNQSSPCNNDTGLCLQFALTVHGLSKVQCKLQTLFPRNIKRVS